MFVPNKATAKLANEKMVHAQGIEIILCCFPNYSIMYPVWKFIIFQVTPTTPYHQGISSCMLDLKRLDINLLNILILLTLKVVPRYHPTRLKTILTIFKYKLSNSTLKETVILLSQMSVQFQNNISLILLIRFLVMSLLPG